MTLVAATAEMVRVLKPTGSAFVNLGDKYQATTFDPHLRGKDASTVRRPAQARVCERAGCGVTFSGGPGRRFCSSFCGGSDNSPRARRGATPNGSLLGIPWRYALRCVDDLGLTLRAELVWEKPNAIPEATRIRRVRRTHETWFHLVPTPKAAWRGLAYYADVSSLAAVAEGGYSVPGSVWRIPTTPLSVPADLDAVHSAAFPVEWPKRFIGAWCPKGGTVLDPFGGTGTTALAAKILGRHGISVDMSADYCRLATWRCSEPGQLAAAMQVDKPAPVAPDQLDLLEGLLA
jgi:DNA modification methylase